MSEVFEFIFPGLMLMFICFIANAVFSDIFPEYKSNTIARLVSSGVTVRQILVSKLLRGMVICWICELLMIVFTGIVFQVNWWNNPLMLLVLLTSFNLFLMGLLAIVYGYARTSDTAGAILTTVFLISTVVAGVFISFNQLPLMVQKIGQWSMIRQGFIGLESIIHARDVWESVRPSLFLSVAGTILMWAGIQVLDKRLRTGRVK